MQVQQWNQLDCSPPPVSTSKVELTRLPNGQEYLHKIRKKLVEATEHLKSPAGSELFQTELYLITRFYYKGACIYKRFRVRRTLRQLRNCLTRLADMKICKSFEDYLGVWPKPAVGEKDVYLPKQEMLQYLLVRLMGGARLLMQTCAYCHHGFDEVMFNLRLGMLAPQMLVIGTCFARVWALCRSLRKRFEEWYDMLAEVSRYIPEAVSDWLQTEIPEKLSGWLPPDPDLPSKDIITVKQLARRSHASHTRTTKTTARQEDLEGLRGEQTSQTGMEIDDPELKDALLDVKGQCDDLGMPISRKNVTELHGAASDSTKQNENEHYDDLGSPVSRTKSPKFLEENMDVAEGDSEQNEDTTWTQGMKKLKKKKRKQLQQKQPSGHELNDASVTTNSGSSQLDSTTPYNQTVLKQKKKKSKTKVNLATNFVSDISESQSQEDETHGQNVVKSDSPNLTKKKLKKSKLLENAMTLTNSSAVASSGKVKRKQLKKLKAAIINEIMADNDCENASASIAKNTGDLSTTNSNVSKLKMSKKKKQKLKKFLASL